MNGIFGFGWIDTIIKLLVYGIIGLIIWIWRRRLIKQKQTEIK